MQILSLELENTKSYKQARIDFTEGMNAIVGHNGAGKSTILEAIGFVLFGSLNYKQDDFVRQNSKSAKATVTFISSLDQRRYQVVRRCGSSTQHLVFDPELDAKICEGKADALRFLSQNMGVEVGADLDKLFRDAVGVPQGTFTAAFLLGQSQRKSIFDPLLQVEEYESAAKKLLDASKYLRDRQESVGQEIARLEARLERLPQLKENLTQQAAEMDNAQTEFDETAKALDQVTQERTALEAIRQQVLDSQREQSMAQQQVQNAENQLANTQRAKAEAENAQAIVQENQAGHTAYEAAQQEQRSLDAQIQQRQRLLQQQATLNTTLARQQTERQNLQQELERAVAASQMVTSLALAVERQATLESELQALQQQRTELQSWQNRVREQETQLSRLRTRHAELAQQLEQGTTVEADLQNALAKIAQIRSTLDEQRANIAGYKAQGDTLNDQNRELEDIATADCPVCEQPLSDTHRNQLLARNQAQLQELRNHYAATHRQIKTDEATLQQSESDQQRLEQTLRRLPRQDEVTALVAEIETAQQTFDHAQTQVNRLHVAPEQLSTLEQEMNTLGNPRQQSAIAQEQANRQPTLEQQLNKVSELGQATESEIAGLTKQLATFEKLDDALANVAADLQRHGAAYQAVLAHSHLAQQLAERTAAAQTAQQQQSDTQQAYERATQRLAEIEGQFDSQKYTQVQAREQELRGQHGALQSRLEMLARSQQQLQQEIESLQSQQETLAKVQSQAAKLTKQSDSLEMLRKLLRQAGPYITQALIRHVSDGAAQIFGEIMQDHTRRLMWNEDYSVTLEVDGRVRQFSQLSGGEQMSAALAVRLSLLREMSNIDVAFFDEPTTNLDETRRESLARQILEIKGFNQLFVISHDDTFEQATENLIRVEQVNGSSQVEAEFMGS